MTDHSSMGNRAFGKHRLKTLEDCEEARPATVTFLNSHLMFKATRVGKINKFSLHRL